MTFLVGSSYKLYSRHAKLPSIHFELFVLTNQCYSLKSLHTCKGPNIFWAFHIKQMSIRMYIFFPFYWCYHFSHVIANIIDNHVRVSCKRTFLNIRLVEKLVWEVKSTKREKCVARIQETWAFNVTWSTIIITTIIITLFYVFMYTVSMLSRLSVPKVLFFFLIVPCRSVQYDSFRPFVYGFFFVLWGKGSCQMLQPLTCRTRWFWPRFTSSNICLNND